MGFTAKEALEFAKQNGAVMADMKFCDMLGTWQHYSVHIDHLTEDSFTEGYGFDGSSIRGWQPINASDMCIVPVPATAKMEPFAKHPTVSFICDVVDPVTHEPYSRDPRNIAKKAVNFLKSTGVGDSVFVGPEAEFFVFDSVRYSQGKDKAFYEVDSDEADWNTGRAEEGGNKGYKTRPKEGYFPVAPWDTLGDIRTEMVLELIKLGIPVEASHHEVATAGQCEIDIRFSDLVTMGDYVMWFKHVVRNVARRNAKVATFMPKPLFGDNGSGMHTHMSIWKDGKNLFAGDKYAGLSQEAMWFIGGIIRHSRALCAFTNPTTNSYKRLVPGFEAPVNIAYSSRNRSAAIRIPVATPNPKARRFEYRTPDPSANPYITFAALLMAGLDGIENQIDPGQPLDKDIYGLPPEELAQIMKAPASLEEALNCLEEDHAFLLRNNVFTEDLIQSWLDRKRGTDVDGHRLRPTPYEYFLYFDC
jgi:glutamine synthetase